MKPRSIHHSSTRFVRFFAAATMLLVHTVQAADGTWTLLSGGSATGTWSDAVTANWSGGTVAGGSGFTADFSTLNISATTSTIRLGVPRTIGNLIFGDTDTASAGGWVLDNNSTPANILTLAGATPTITTNALGTNSLVSISAVIDGTNGLIKNGTGTISTGILALSGANTYSGGTTISTGSIRAQNNTALGSGSVTVASGARLQLSGGVNIANTIYLNGTSALYGNTGANTLSGSVNLQSASTLSMASANDNNLNLSNSLNLAGNVLTVSTANNTNSFVTISGTINGGGGITKNNDGPLTISNNQTLTYSGTTTLSRGVLIFGSDGALGTGTFTFGSNDTTIAMRSSSTASRTLGNALTLAGNAATVYTFGSTTASVNGDLIFSNTGNIAMGGTSRRLVVHNRTEFAGAFTGTGGITKQTGTGTLVLKGVNTYTGATAVNAGTLLVNGSLASGSAVTVDTGGTLGGTGTVGGATTILAGGTLAVGNSIGKMNFSQTLSLAGISNFEIDPTLALGLNADLANVTGGVTYGGTLNVTYGGLSSNFANGMLFNLFDASAITGSFSAINLPTLSGGLTWQNDLATNGSITVVPESSAALLGGLGMLCLLRRRRGTPNKNFRS